MQILMSMMVQAYEGVMGRGAQKVGVGKTPRRCRGTQVGDVMGRSGGSAEKEARWVVFRAFIEAVGG